MVFKPVILVQNLARGSLLLPQDIHDEWGSILGVPDPHGEVGWSWLGNIHLLRAVSSRTRLPSGI